VTRERTSRKHTTLVNIIIKWAVEPNNANSDAQRTDLPLLCDERDPRWRIMRTFCTQAGVSGTAWNRVEPLCSSLSRSSEWATCGLGWVWAVMQMELFLFNSTRVTTRIINFFSTDSESSQSFSLRSIKTFWRLLVSLPASPTRETICWSFSWLHRTNFVTVSGKCFASQLNGFAVA
jgi:hypothetical protein